MKDFSSSREEPDHLCADARERSPWLPIETAPKDGTMFVAWRSVPTWDEDEQRNVAVWEPCIAQTVFGEVCSIPLHYMPRGQRITHWMPLPAPPSSAKPVSGVGPGTTTPHQTEQPQ